MAVFRLSAAAETALLISYRALMAAVDVLRALISNVTTLVKAAADAVAGSPAASAAPQRGVELTLRCTAAAAAALSAAPAAPAGLVLAGMVGVLRDMVNLLSHQTPSPWERAATEAAAAFAAASAAASEAAKHSVPAPLAIAAAPPSRKGYRTAKKPGTPAAGALGAEEAADAPVDIPEAAPDVDCDGIEALASVGECPRVRPPRSAQCARTDAADARVFVLDACLTCAFNVACDRVGRTEFAGDIGACDTMCAILRAVAWSEAAAVGEREQSPAHCRRSVTYCAVHRHRRSRRAHCGRDCVRVGLLHRTCNGAA